MKLVLKIIVSLLFRVRTKNFDRLKAKGRVIIMPNHVSFLDGFFLYLFLPREAVFVINTQMAERYAMLVHFARHVTIDHLNPYAIKDIIHYVKDDAPLVIFPEGRISTTKGLMKIYDGVGFIALKTGAKVYPLIIDGLEYSKFSRIKDLVKTRWFPGVQLYVDEPFQLTMEKDRSIKEQRREAGDLIYKTLNRALFNSRAKEDTNLFNEVVDAAKLAGRSKVIVSDLNSEVTYKKLILSSYVLARKFMKIEEQRVAVLLPNVIAHVAALLGLCFVNKTPAIINFSSGAQTIIDCLEMAGIKSVITSREFVEKGGFTGLIEQLEQNYTIIYLEDIRAQIATSDKIAGLLYNIIGKKAKDSKENELILFTSGSESKPKGVVLSHANIYNNITQATATLDFCSKDVMFNALPMFHSFGLTAGTFLPLLTGARVFLYPSPLHFKIIPEVAYDTNATVILGTSMFFAGYGKYAHPYDFYAVRYAIVGAEKLKEDVRQLWQDKFGIRILEGYGCTETAPILALNTPLFYKKGTVGHLMPGMEYKIEKVEGIEKGGNLYVKGPNVMKGYLIYGQGYVPAAQWYDTGDIVTMDEKGYITITSRLKRFAKISGEMVSLNQVEELAEKCFGSDVSFAAVSINDPKKGEKIIMVTTDERVSLKEFKNYLLANQYSMLLSPDEIIVSENIPILGSGKTDYITLKEIVAG